METLTTSYLDERDNPLTSRRRALYKESSVFQWTAHGLENSVLFKLSQVFAGRWKQCGDLQSKVLLTDVLYFIMSAVSYFYHAYYWNRGTRSRK